MSKSSVPSLKFKFYVNMVSIISGKYVSITEKIIGIKDGGTYIGKLLYGVSN